MNLKNRISTFAELGSALSSLAKSGKWMPACQSNEWFTGSETERALNAWARLLTGDNLTAWTNPYRIPDAGPIRNILVITAGNIPLVGFHDFLSVLITGHRFTGKLSSRDQLLALLADEVIRIGPGFAERISFDDFSGSPDAVIATGSDNSSRYFHSAYRSTPHIIRKNRNSAAIIDGSETPGELKNLAGDILEYYGLGCRSVSHLFLPRGFSPLSLLEPISGFNRADSCRLLTDNINYQKARLTVLGTPYLDAHHVLLVESERLQSPIGVVHYSFYGDNQELLNLINAHDTELQCLIGHATGNSGCIPFGSAQKPELWDYSDNIDTLNFLNQLA